MITTTNAETMIELFEKRATAAGAILERLANHEVALVRATALLRGEYGVEDKPGRRAVWAAPAKISVAEQQHLRASVPGLNFEVTRDVAADSLVGVSHMDFGIASTGTLVQDSQAVEERLVSTLPETHIAFLHAKSIVPDLGTAVMSIHPDKSSYIAFITGPSRTADIERVLMIGVHGPKQLHILLVGSDEEEQ